MSTTAVAEFILKRSSELSTGAMFAGETVGDRIAAFVAAGRAQGYEFTAAECLDFLRFARELGGELTEDRLERVVGGSGGDANRILEHIQNALFAAIGPVTDEKNGYPGMRAGAAGQAAATGRTDPTD